MANYQQLKNALVDVIKQNGSNEITGEIMQTTLLSMINSLGANYQFAGILTPSTSFVAPDENVFLIGEGGTYNNFGTDPIVVPKGSIGLFMYNGTYSSHVIQSNGVLNVSALNAVSGTPTQYSTLQNALNAIPSSLRYNGMEIIYIDSTTGQYVKYRMIAKEWSTLSSAWQGVDDELKAFSINLAKSGEVYEKIKNEVGYDIPNLTFVDNEYVNYNGVISPQNQYKRSEAYPAEKGQTIHVIGKGQGTVVAMIALCDSDESNIQVVVRSSGDDTKEYTYTMQNDGYFIVSSQKILELSIEIEKIDSLSKINSRVTALEELPPYVYKDNEDFTMTTGGYIDHNGGVASQNSNSYSSYIPIEKCTVIYADIMSGTRIAYYDEQYNFLTYWNGDGTGKRWHNVSAHQPLGCAFVRFSNMHSDMPNTSVKVRCIYGKALFDEMQQNKENKVNILAMYDDIICCGDSLTYGQVYLSASNSRQAFSPYPKVIEKLTGIISHNFSTAGITTQNWWGSYANELSQDGLYLICLGTNGGLTDTIDTDCVGDDPSQFANTNTGCYGKILQTIKNNGNKALLIRCWVLGNSTTNDVIEKFAKKYDFPYIDLSSQWQRAEYHYYPDKSGSNAVHFNDLGYAWMANDIINKVGNMALAEQFKIMRTI